ncbi:MAG: DUF3313 domain-containing protein [Gammaproteobacteria bacterium]|nr:DUF3313 domain-containing protein [Gammaproteobacteria bacterium]
MRNPCTYKRPIAVLSESAAPAARSMSPPRTVRTRLAMYVPPALETPHNIKGMFGIFTLCSLMFAFGCTRVEVYRDLRDGRLDRVYVKENADFSGYDAVAIDTVSVWYPPGLGPDIADLRAMEELFHQAIVAALADAYRIAQSPGRGILQLHVQFVDLSGIAPDQDIPEPLGRYEFKTAAGHITLVGELTDSVTGEVLARAADLGIGELWVHGEALDRESISIDFRRWARIFRDWMDEVTNRRAGQR